MLNLRCKSNQYQGQSVYAWLSSYNVKILAIINWSESHYSQSGLII